MAGWLKNFINDNRDWIVTVVQWFLLAMVIGGIAYFVKPDLLNSIVNLFQNKFGSDQVLNVQLAQSIFVQNLEACLLALIGSIFFGVAVFLVVFFNGFIIGFVVIALVATPGNPLLNILYTIAGLLPHGIFELPAFFLASALGLRFGVEWLQQSAKGQRLKVLKDNFIRVLYGLPIIAILLIIAAFVEVFVSGNLVGNFH